MKTMAMGLFGGLLLAALLVITPQNAMAQQIAANVKIERIVQTSTYFEFRANEVDRVAPPALFTNKLFRVADGPKQNNYLAIALTAVSTGKTVRVFFIDGNPATVNGMGLID